MRNTSAVFPCGALRDVPFMLDAPFVKSVRVTPGSDESGDPTLRVLDPPLAVVLALLIVVALAPHVLKTLSIRSSVIP